MAIIIPAILTNDLRDLENKLKKIEGLASWVQIDIMDGRFVDNVSCEIKNIPKNITKSFHLEIHLMVLNPWQYFQGCQEIGAEKVFFHEEAVEDLKIALEEAKKFNFKIGIAINPATPVEKIKPYLNEINYALLLGVNPGFQNQKFMPVVLNKIKELKNIATKIIIEVDGGINLETGRQCVESGADALVVGSYIFNSDNYQATIKKLSMINAQ